MIFGNKYVGIQKEELVKKIEPIIRKLAHYILYTIGGVLIANLVYQFYKKEKKVVIISLVIGILYAITDEIHQLSIINRNGNIKDVFIDSLGLFTGIIFFLLVIKIINSKQKQVEG